MTHAARWRACFRSARLQPGILLSPLMWLGSSDPKLFCVE
jgi:hypothetical protein